MKKREKKVTFDGKLDCNRQKLVGQKYVRIGNYYYFYKIARPKNTY